MKEQNRFIKKFSEKTESELEEILKNDKHVIEAKLAAGIILKSKTYRIVTLDNQKKTPTNKNLISPTNSEKKEYLDFIKSHSYREFLTIITLSLFLICLQKIRWFYPEYEFIQKTNIGIINIVVLYFVMNLNHIQFKNEHSRSNSFTGRIFIDIEFLIVYIFMYQLSIFTFSINFGHIFALLFLAFINESIYHVLKKAFKFL